MKNSTDYYIWTVGNFFFFLNFDIMVFFVCDDNHSLEHIFLNIFYFSISKHGEIYQCKEHILYFQNMQRSTLNCSLHRLLPELTRCIFSIFWQITELPNFDLAWVLITPQPCGVAVFSFWCCAHLSSCIKVLIG